MGYSSGTGSHCCRHCSSIDNILQQNTLSVISIHCHGSVVKAAAYDPQGPGFDP